jgi:hypothetical protein
MRQAAIDCCVAAILLARSYVCQGIGGIAGFYFRD